MVSLLTWCQKLKYCTWQFSFYFCMIFWHFLRNIKWVICILQHEWIFKMPVRKCVKNLCIHRETDRQTEHFQWIRISFRSVPSTFTVYCMSLEDFENNALVISTFMILLLYFLSLWLFFKSMCLKKWWGQAGTGPSRLKAGPAKQMRHKIIFSREVEKKKARKHDKSNCSNTWI